MDTAIQLGELPCGCWVVLDGNNRIALVLEKDPKATVAVLPRRWLLLFQDGEWDREWSPQNPQPFEFVRTHSTEFYRVQRNKRQFKSLAAYQAEVARLRKVLDKTPHQCGGVQG
jgi:hypothetical protein